MATGIKNIFGGATINEGRSFPTPESLQEALDVLRKGDCQTIDTAALYGQSETIIGQARAGGKVTIDTKTRGGFGDRPATQEVVVEEAAHSREVLGCTVDIFYVHAVDSRVDLASTLAGVNDVYRTGFFRRFGLSNFKAEDVERVHAICSEKGYPLPTVYQGSYSAVARRQETELFPTLRRLGMSFYAYSPIAGGFLTKTRTDIEAGAGRFAKDSMYARLYARPAYLEALAEWERIAADEGIPRAELAYRWVKYNSPLKPAYGDAIIVGASSLDQLKQTLGSIGKGPLSESAVQRIDQVWETIKHEAPLDNYHY